LSHVVLRLLLTCCCSDCRSGLSVPLTEDQSPMTQVNVLAVIDSLGAGGAERSFLELLPALAQEGVHVRFACLDQRPHGVESEVRELGVPVEVLAASNLPGRVRELRRLVDQHRPDLIHTTLFQADLVGRLANLANRTPLMTSIVNTTYDAARRADPNVPRWKLEMVRLLDGLGARHATDHFHALTESAAADAVRSLGVDRADMSVVPRSRDEQRFRFDREGEAQRVREELGLTDEPMIVTVGREEFQKAHTVLMKAFHEVLDVLPDARLVLVGRPGNASKDIESAVERLDLADAVVRTSFRSDVPSFLAAADVFAFPSFYEGFGGAMIEAMAMATPIVCSDIPVLREVLVDPGAGIFSPPGDSSTLSDALIETLANRAAASARADVARRIYEERYVPEVVGPAMAALYRRVAGS